MNLPIYPGKFMVTMMQEAGGDFRRENTEGAVIGTFEIVLGLTVGALFSPFEFLAMLCWCAWWCIANRTAP